LQSLIGTSPLPVSALQVGYKYAQVIVLVADGLNTQNRWSTRQSSIDTRTQKSLRSGEDGGRHGIRWS
jgi:hypothetical protein